MSHIAGSRKSYTAQFKTKIVMAGLEKACSIRELCRRNGLSESVFYNWRKRFTLAGSLGLKRKSCIRHKKPKPRSAIVIQKEEMGALRARFDEYRQCVSPYPTRMSSSEKMAAIDLVKSSKISKRCTLQCLAETGH